MSLFINSKVHLPSSCEKCPFNYADMSTGICTAADKTIDTRTYGRKRHPDCPITEIPTPHGRLVDADNLVKVLQNTLDNYPDNYNDRKTVEKLIVAVCKRYIENAPTIIEAEVSE